MRTADVVLVDQVMRHCRSYGVSRIVASPFVMIARRGVLCENEAMTFGWISCDWFRTSGLRLVGQADSSGGVFTATTAEPSDDVATAWSRWGVQQNVEALGDMVGACKRWMTIYLGAHRLAGRRCGDRC